MGNKMEYYKNIREFINMASLRLDQLNLEAKIDNNLKQVSKKCPEEVNRYMFNMRELNRFHATKIHNVSIIEYPEHMKNAYNDVEKIQKQFWWVYLGHTCPDYNICLNILPRLNDMIEKDIKSKQV